MLKRIQINLKSFKWNLWIALCLLAFIPAIYQTISTAIVSTTVSSNGIDILGQMEWFDLIDETIKAFLIVPLYSILNRIYQDNKKEFPTSVFKSGFCVFILYLLFSLGVFIYGKHLISLMNPTESNIPQINQYLMLETIAFIFGIIPTFINVVFITIGKSKNVYIFMGVKVIMGILTDFIFIPSLGVNGIAISNIIGNIILTIMGIVVLHYEQMIKISWFSKKDKKEGMQWLKTGFFSGSQQFIDNFVYAIMIAKMVNMVAEQGNYWVANNFIWGWLLIPITALAEIIKGDCKEEYTSLKQSNYYIIILFSIILWMITIPCWTLFFKNVQRLENYKEIFLITIKSTPFYIAYSLCIVPDSIFIGKGKTILNTINSLCVNCIYYGIWFILYKLNVISFTMNMIILMFGFGMVFHLIISWMEQFIWVSKNRKRDKNEKISNICR